MSAWKKTEFKTAVNPHYISADRETGTRKGYVNGPFGINKGGWAEDWNVTHLASGFSAAKTNTFRGAKAKTAELIEAGITLGIDWFAKDPLKPLTEDKRATLQKIMRAQ